MKSRRLLNRAAFSIIVLSTLVALFYAVENWRGARAWASTLENLEAKGEKIALNHFETAAVNDETNAAMHPALRCFSYCQPGGTRAIPTVSDPDNAAMADQWRAFLAWTQTSPDPFTRINQVLEESNPDLTPAREAIHGLKDAMDEHSGIMDAVVTALQRPICQWPPASGIAGGEPAVRGDFSASIGYAMSETVRYFKLKAICRAIPDGDLKSWDEGVDFSIFAKPASSPKTVMNYLLAIAVRGHQQQLFINLLEFSKPDPERCFKAEALLASQAPFCPAYSEFMRGERAYMIAAITSMLQQEDPSSLSWIISGETPARGWAQVERVVRGYGPVGWLKQNLANSVRGTGELIEAFDLFLAPDTQWKGLTRVVSDSKSKSTLFHGMEKATIDLYSSTFGSAVRSDATRNLLRSALIIAAHRFQTGIAPMSLDELPSELRVRIPISPLKKDLPRIKRNGDGVWTITYSGFDDPKGWEPEWSIQIRGW